MRDSPQPASDASRRLHRVWLFVSVAWIGPAILAAFQAFVQGRLGNRAPATWRTLAWESGDWLLYALLTPAVFWVARRYPLVGRDAVGRIPLHLFISIALCAAWAGSGVFLWQALFSDPVTSWGAGVSGWFLTSLPFGVAVYFALLGAEHAAFYFFEARERAAHTARLSTQLTQARLDALRMQMRPHFLRRFLAIEEVRFSDRLRPELDVPRELLGAAVPELLLQPLVENALRHGLAHRATATLLRIEARREGDELVLTVTDDGPGPVDALGEQPSGVGLANTRERLATLYGSSARLDLMRAPGEGAAAVVRLPDRDLAPVESAAHA